MTCAVLFLLKSDELVFDVVVVDDDDDDKLLSELKSLFNEEDGDNVKTYWL